MRRTVAQPAEATVLVLPQPAGLSVEAWRDWVADGDAERPENDPAAREWLRNNRWPPPTWPSMVWLVYRGDTVRLRRPPQR